MAELSQNYRLIFNSLDEGFVISELLYDDAGKPVDLLVLETNDSFNRMLRVTNPVGKRAKEIFSSAEDSWFEAYGQVVETGESIRFTNYLAALDSWFDLYISRIGDPSSRQFVIVFHEISERKRAEVQMAFLADISRELMGLRSIDEKIRQLGSKIGQCFNVKWCMCAENLSKSERPIITAAWNADDVPSLFRTHDINEFAPSEMLASLHDGKPVIVQDVRHDARVSTDLKGSLAAHEIGSFVIIPLLHENEWRFLVSIIDNKPRIWRDDEVAVLTEAGARIWSQLERARVEASLRERDERQAFLLRLMDTIRPLTDPIVVQGEACRLVADRLDADRAYYVEIDEASGIARVDRDFVRSGSYSLTGVHRISDFAWSVEIVRRGECYAIPDTQASPLVPVADRLALAALDIVSCIGVPLIKDDKLVGALCVTGAQVREWTQLEVELLKEVGERIWTSIERARAEAALQTSEAQHRALFDAIDEGVCLIERLPLRADGRRDYRYLAMNPAMQAMFGIPDLSGQSIRDNFPNEVEDWYDDYDRVLATGQPIRFERESLPQGLVLEMFVSRLEDGSQRLLAVMQDVTKRKFAERKLLVSEERQRFLLKLSDAVRPLADPDTIQAVASWMLGEYLGVNRVHYAEIVDNGVTVRQGYGNGLPPMIGQFRSTDFGARLIAEHRLGRIAICYDTDTDPQITAVEREVLRSTSIGAYIAVPLIKEGIWVSTLAVQSIQRRDWTPEEVVLIVEVAERTWAAVERARAEAALHTLNTQLEQRVIERTEDLKQSQEQLRALSARVEMAREAERARIAREVHDELGGSLSGLKFSIARVIDGRVSADGMAEARADITTQIDGLVKSVRRIASELRPPLLDDLGLFAAMEWQAAEWERHTGIACILRLPRGDVSLSQDQRTALFRVFQESLTNVARHAGRVTEVVVVVRYENSVLVLSVHDNGVGIDMSVLQTGKSLGLLGMRERIREIKGNLEIFGGSGQGTTVIARVPLNTTH